MSGSDTGDGSKDKRLSPRARCTLLATCANLSAHGRTGYRYSQSAVIDISDSGVGLKVEEEVQKGDLLQLVISLPVRPFVITGLAEVVWTRPATDLNRVRAGLRFVQLPADLDKAVVDQLIAASASTENDDNGEQ